MFEMASCAAQSLTPEGSVVGLTGVAIPSPLVLSGVAAPAAEAALDCRTGAVELASLSGKGTGEGVEWSAGRAAPLEVKFCGCLPTSLDCGPFPNYLDFTLNALMTLTSMPRSNVLRTCLCM